MPGHSVSWDALWIYADEAGRTTATHVPTLLERLGRARRAVRPWYGDLSALESCLEHQGGLSPAVVPVVPRVYALLANTSPSRRGALIRLLHLFAVPQPGNLYPDVVEPARDYAARPPRCFHACADSAIARACFEAVERDAFQLLPFVRDPDPDVACEAIALLSQFRRHARATSRELGACYERRLHAEVLACVLLADARLGGASTARPIVFAEYLDAAQANVRFAAACIVAAEPEHRQRALAILARPPRRGVRRLHALGPDASGLAAIHAAARV